MSEKKSYHVHTPVLHDKPYKRGDKIDLTEDEAKPLLHVGAVAHHPAEGEAKLVEQKPATTEPEKTGKAVAEMTRAERIAYAKDTLKLSIANNISNDELLAKIAEGEAKLVEQK